MSHCHIFKQSTQGLSLLVLRFFVAYEFFEAGLENGTVKIGFMR